MSLLHGKGTTAYTKIRRAFASEVLRSAFDEAVENGWGYRVTGGCHVFLTNGKTGIQMSTTATDGRAVKNALAHMRRKGALRRQEDVSR